MPVALPIAPRVMRVVTRCMAATPYTTPSMGNASRCAHLWKGAATATALPRAHRIPTLLSAKRWPMTSA